MILIKKSPQYWKEVALKKVLNENEAKELAGLVPSRVFLICKAAIKNAKNMNIHEIIFCLKFQYSAHNRSQITLIQGILSH